MVDHNVVVGDYSIAWKLQMSACKRKKIVLVPLVMPVHPCTKQWSSFAHCLEPQIFEQGIFDQPPVMGDGFFGDGVYYSIVVFFDFNNRACILIMDKFARDFEVAGA
jgi:hypothetical protein